MRLIDADKAKEEILSWAVDLNNPQLLSKADTLCIIDQQPTVEAEPVKHGRWMHTDAAASWRAKDECSVCHYATTDRIDLSYFHYCPNCGAKMDLEVS